MKQWDEDQAFEQFRQRQIDNDEWDVCNPMTGTVIPFSRTTDRDPNPRIPLSVPENSYPSMQRWEWVTWALLVGFWVMLVVAYNMGWLS